MNKKYLDMLTEVGACGEANKWAKSQRTPAAAWKACNDPQWMLWLVGRLSGNAGSNERRQLVLCACECARLALPHVAKGETRPLQAIEMAERWARKEKGVTLAMVESAANASYAAYDAAKKKVNAQFCKIIRKHYPRCPMPKKIEAKKEKK